MYISAERRGIPDSFTCRAPPAALPGKKRPDFDQFIEFEDVPVVFFDADHDGDLDLFVGPGGNNAAANSRQMQNRFV